MYEDSSSAPYLGSDSKPQNSAKRCRIYLNIPRSQRRQSNPTKNAPKVQEASARAIFPYNNKKYKEYVHWQSLQPGYKSCNEGKIPTAFEYQDFMRWSEDRENFLPDPYFMQLLLRTGPEPDKTAEGDLKKATICNHLLHPGCTIKELEYCPLCIVKTHLHFQSVVKDAMLQQDFPWKKPPPGAVYCVNQWMKASVAWYSAKMEFVDSVYRIQCWADDEQSWEHANPDANLSDVKSCASALDLCCCKNWYPIRESKEPKANSSNERAINNSSSLQTQASKPKKTVHFAQDIQESPSRENTYFSRRSIAYSPGSHACPDEEGWADTSFMRDPEYTISQCEIRASSSKNTETGMYSFAASAKTGIRGDEELIQRAIRIFWDALDNDDEDAETLEDWIREINSWTSAIDILDATEHADESLSFDCHAAIVEEDDTPSYARATGHASDDSNIKITVHHKDEGGEVKSPATSSTTNPNVISIIKSLDRQSQSSSLSPNHPGNDSDEDEGGTYESEEDDDSSSDSDSDSDFDSDPDEEVIENDSDEHDDFIVFGY